MASTGDRSRRDLLRAAASASVALALGAPSGAADYASPAEALRAIDAFEAEVVARLEALGRSVAPARAFASSLLRDLERHRRGREATRRRLGLGIEEPARVSPAAPLDLRALHGAQEKLAYAHAEALPAFADPRDVRSLARHMVDAARHLAVTALWLDAEEERG
ncbi:MAG TPA: twin-arginine translocation signal domain-containing protein [Vicinamibacteria bacterium]|nr:twin-arginine translocation signal domain-containing protein [Vicinamibacteria bacterium]